MGRENYEQSQVSLKDKQARRETRGSAKNATWPFINNEILSFALPIGRTIFCLFACLLVYLLACPLFVCGLIVDLIQQLTKLLLTLSRRRYKTMLASTQRSTTTSS